MTIRMQQRNGTAARWLELDPILASAEIGYETDTGRFKFGNGIDNWTELEYYSSVQDLLLGQANGIATLDGTGNVPSSQLNNIVIPEIPPATILSDTQPQNPDAGTRWFKTSTAQEFLYYNSAWIEI
jgi:hypothetical protein